MSEHKYIVPDTASSSHDEEWEIQEAHSTEGWESFFSFIEDRLGPTTYLQFLRREF